MKGTHRKWAGALAMAGVMVLAACSEGATLRAIEETPLSVEAGGSFAEYLAVEYADAAEQEAYVSENWVDARMYAFRAYLSNRGQVLDPLDPLNFKVGDELEQLLDARRYLLEALNLGGRTDAARREDCAQAQRYYDSWVEEASDNDWGTGGGKLGGRGGPSVVAEMEAARDAYEVALDECLGIREEAGAAAGHESDKTKVAAVSGEDTWTVYFAFDSVALDDDDSRVLREIVEQAEVGSIDIVGHTDSSGPSEYNQALGLRRAQAVAEVLRGMGLVTEPFVSSEGEDSLAVPTPDDTREPFNRRTEIVIY